MSNAQPRMQIISTVALYEVHRSLAATGGATAAGPVEEVEDMSRSLPYGPALRRMHEPALAAAMPSRHRSRSGDGAPGQPPRNARTVFITVCGCSRCGRCPA